MNLLLDTCAILFLSSNHEVIRPSTRKFIEQANQIYVSAISSAELACLQERGRIELPSHWKPWLREAIAVNGWNALPISMKIMEEAYSLPGTFHPDPADRILTASARIENLEILTTDQKIHNYPHVTSRW